MGPARSARSDSQESRGQLHRLVADARDHLTQLLHRVVATVRGVHDRVDEVDPTSADLLHVVIDSLEKHAWMISAEIPH